MTNEEFQTLLTLMRNESLPSATADAIQAHVDGLNAQIDRLEGFKIAYMQFDQKTEWLQSCKTPVRFLGQHRADIMKEILIDTKRLIRGIENDRLNMTAMERIKEALVNLDG